MKRIIPKFVGLQEVVMAVMLLSQSLSMVATNYVNNTEKTIRITNVSEKKRQKKQAWKDWIKRIQQSDEAKKYFIELEKGDKGDLDNKQDDEITITSPGVNNKRRLFPTNNYFNYVITANNYSSKFEQFDINHAE